jgi:hypothetical protein
MRQFLHEFAVQQGQLPKKPSHLLDLQKLSLVSGEFAELQVAFFSPATESPFPL